jgi:hypothetical protein
MNKKDGFNGSLSIGDKLFPESADLGLGDVVTAENIAELAAIFTNESLITAVADSVATAQLVTVTLPSLAAVDAAVDFLKQRYVDVDFDGIGNGVTIFGDDQRIHVSESGDGDEGHWVLNLVIPQTALVATFRKPSGETVTDTISYHEPMSEALDAANEDAHRYGWTFVSLQTVTA